MKLRAPREAARPWLITAWGAVFLLLSIASAFPARATQDTPTKSLIVERPESDVLLLAVRLDQSTLADALPAWQDQSRVLLPFGELCRLLGLGITVDVARGTATGFFVTDKRRFDLDVVARKVIVEGKGGRFDPGGIEVHQDDVYVDAALISEWLPIRLDVDLYGSLVTVRPGERLPLQLRLERERKLETSRSRPGQAASNFPRLPLPYRLADGPFVDQTFKFQRQPSAGGGATNSLQYSTYATGDLLFLEANVYLSGTEGGLTDGRLSLGRKDPEGMLLGFLGAREVTVGDVFYPGLDLIAQPHSGPGVLVSSFPLQLPSQFDRQSFRGNLPPGWDVELYRAEELLAYAQSRADGLYEFLDVPLLFGMNVFRLEFYGPQGQRRTETQSLNVDQTLTPKGKLYYRIAGNDPSVHLVGSGSGDAGSRASAEVSAGLSRHLSASASVASLGLGDGRHTYGKAGLRGFWGFLFANADLAVDRSGGSALQGTLQSRLGAFGFLVQYVSLSSFESETFRNVSGPLRSRATIRLDSAVPQTFLPRIPVSVEVKEDVQENGQRIVLLSGRLSAFRRGLSISNVVLWNLSSGGSTASSSTASGQLLVSKYLGVVSLRGEVAYDIEPASAVTSIALTAESRLVKNYLLTAGVNRQLSSGQTKLLAGASRLEGVFGVSATAEYSSPGGLGFSVLLSIGIGRDARSGRWHVQARPMAGNGAVSGRAFLDSNGNGVMDAGEKPIPEVGYLQNGAGNMARTDETGVAFLPNLSPYQDLDFGLATGTLEDPYWKPSREGVKLTPRPGKVAVIDFPVVASGEITGTVYVRRGGKSREAGGVELHLVGAKGTVVKKLRTAYDGFYDLADILPGRYTLRVAEGQAERLGAQPPLPREVEMAPSGTVLDGVNFVLEVEASEETPPASESIAPKPVAPSPTATPMPQATTAPVAAARTHEGSSKARSFAVHVSSYREQWKADAEAVQLGKQFGTVGRSVEVDLGAKGTWHRVVLGRFATADEARLFRAEIDPKIPGGSGPVLRIEAKP